MTPEMIAIVAVGVTLAGMILHANRETRRDLGGRIDTLSERVDALSSRVNALEQRIARLEGLFEGLIRGKIELPPITGS